MEHENHEMTEHRKNIRLFEKYSTAERKEWVRQISDDEQFKLGEQWTPEEIRELEARGHAPLVINRVLPVVELRKSQLISQNPKYKVFPRENADPKVATVIKMAIDHVLVKSDGETVISEIVDSSETKGVGYAYVYFDPYADFGRGEVYFDFLLPEEVYVSPESRKRDFSDVPILVVKEFSRSQIRNLFPDMADEILSKKDTSGGVNFLDRTYDSDIGVKRPGDVTKEEVYVVYERYETIKKKHYILDEPFQVFDEEQIQKIEEDAAMGVPEAVQVLQSVRPVWLDRERVVTTCNDVTIQDTLLPLPISGHPIIPYVNIWTNTPYPMSTVRVIRGLQKEINKRRSLLISHATRSSASPLIYEEGSTPMTPEELATAWARPGAAIPVYKGSSPPHQMPPLPLPGALYNLEELAKMDIEYTTGVFGLSQGQASQAPATYSATIAIDEYATRRIAIAAKNLNLFLGKLGQRVYEFCAAFYGDNKMLRITNSLGETEEAVANLVVDYSGTVQRLNDISKGFYEVVFLGGSTLATSRQAKLQQALQLYQAGILDDIEVYKNLDGVDVGALLERKSQLMQAVQMNQQMQQQIEEMLKQMESITEENKELKEQIELEKFKAQLKRQLDELKLARKELDLQKKRVTQNER